MSYGSAPPDVPAARNGRVPAGGFVSILVADPERRRELEVAEPPACLADLNLDQVLAELTSGREEYDLTPFLHAPLQTVEEVHYRHEVLRDLARDAVATPIRAFGEAMRTMREHLARAAKLHYERQQQRWFLDAVEVYCDAVGALADGLDALELGSRGLRALRDYVEAYVASPAFTSLAQETRELQEDLAGVTYSVHIKGNRVRVGPYEGEPDYSAEVEETFARFKQGAVKDYRVALPSYVEMNHVEARVLDLVARLYPDVFGQLEDYRARRQDYLDPTLAAFDREVQLYLAYLEHMGRVTPAGLAFCLPEVVEGASQVHAEDGFDLALAGALAGDRAPVVPNSLRLDDPERILVVTGPNQGGKTTFARTVGQLHYLAALGLPVPARSARLPLADRVLTHFEREEDATTLRGKLEDELVRLREILEVATERSVVVMNESFSSTALRDTLFIGTRVIERISQLGAVCVYVTFVDELSTLNERTVSMVAEVAPERLSERTFRVVRRRADGLAYALALAERHGLTYETLRRRIAR
jgi:hypothetical protein